MDYEFKTEESSWNMGLSTIYRLHDNIEQYKQAYIVSNPAAMYKLAFALYLELEAEMTEEEINKQIELIHESKKKLNHYNKKIINYQNAINQYKFRNIAPPTINDEVFNIINDWFLQIKRVMKRLDLHLPKKDLIDFKDKFSATR